MKHIVRSRFGHALSCVVLFVLLIGLAGGALPAGAASTAIDTGYVDVVYGTNVDDELTGTGAESKVWYADGSWWAVLFNSSTNLYEIYRYNGGTNSWVGTGTALDTRQDAGETDGNTTIDNRHDVLFKNNKLYVASHVDVLNAAHTNNDTQWGKLFRYTYNPTTDVYTLDSGFNGVNLNTQRTEALVIDMETDLTLWTSFVARPSGSGTPHRVWANMSGSGDAGQATWPAATDLSTVAAIGATAATVSSDDISTVVTYGTKTGVLWSNQLTGKFYFAEHDNTQAVNAGWTLYDLSTVAPVPANDFVKLVSDAAGNVYAVVRSLDTAVPPANNSEVGVYKKTGATWTYHQVSTVGSADTEPTAVLNSDTNVLTVFVVSNEGGGLVCFNSAPTATMAFTAAFNCNQDTPANQRALADDIYNRFRHPTTSKAPVTNASGILVLASDDVNGTIYGHNLIGGTVQPDGPLDLIATTPSGPVTATQIVATASFNNAINTATLNTTTFSVTGPGGAVAGTVTYDAAARKATFTSNAGATLVNGTYTATITTALKDVNGDGLDSNESWNFQFTLQTQPPAGIKYYLPYISR